MTTKKYYSEHGPGIFFSQPYEQSRYWYSVASVCRL